jgi:uncharacterized Zn finger protein
VKSATRPRFDLAALRGRAGDAVFARGEAYWRDGQVQLLAIEPGRVLAEVAGTEDYRIALRGQGRTIDGECSCPAFSDWGFCKHMVATALAANAEEAEGAAEGALGRIREHLKGLGTDVLVEMILVLAERDPALFRKLELAAAATQADEKVLGARLRKAIDGATRTRGFVDYREAGGWAAGVESALEAVAALVPAGRATLALDLALHAIDRIEDAIEEIDDSDGHCGGLLEHAQEIHLEAAGIVRPEPAALAHELFGRETAGAWGTFDGACTLYGEILGDAGLAEYRRLAEEAWAKLPARTGGRDRSEYSSEYRRLAAILDFFAERDGDVEARIALRAKDLSSTSDHLNLARFCLSVGREAEALRRAEDGLFLFDDQRPDERLVLFTAELLEKAGRAADAEARLWQAFGRQPSLALYDRLRALAGTAARDRAIAALKAPRTAGRPDPVDLLVRILMQEKMFDAAWAEAGRQGASVHVKEELARASERTHPAAAVAVFAGKVETLAGSGGDRAYAEAASLVRRMASLQGPDEHAAYLAALKLRHGRKRNFMKLLG